MTAEEVLNAPLPADAVVAEAERDAAQREAEIRVLREQIRHVSPQAEKAVPLASVLRLPNARDIYRHLDELYPVTSISRGGGATVS